MPQEPPRQNSAQPRQPGLILKNYAGYYYVQTAPGQPLVECRVRGKMKDFLLTGDRVEITLLKTSGA